jgi:hypothetical protein
MLPYRDADAVRMEDFRVRPADRPGWVLGSTRLPLKGEAVFCAAGEGTVTALLGRTGNGSRLVQIALPGAAKPFFAAASNVLIAPSTGAIVQAGRDERGADPEVEAEAWLGGSGSAIDL